MSKDFWDLLKARPIQIKEWAWAGCLLNEASGIYGTREVRLWLFTVSPTWNPMGSLAHESFHWFLYIRPQSPALTLLINSFHSLHVGFAFETSNEKPALLVCVREYDPDPLLVKWESDLGPEDLAVASKSTVAELSSSSKLSARKLERGKQQRSCLTKNVNSCGTGGLLGDHNRGWYY